SCAGHCQESKASLLLMLARLTAAVTLVLLGFSADGKTEDCSLLRLYCAVCRSRPSVPKPVSGGRMPVRTKNSANGEASGKPNPCASWDILSSAMYDRCGVFLADCIVGPELDRGITDGEQPKINGYAGRQRVGVSRNSHLGGQLHSAIEARQEDVFAATDRVLGQHNGD